MKFHRYLAPEGEGSAGGTTPPAGTPPAPPAGPAVAWLPEADTETAAYVQNKGWANPGDVLKGYKNLETMLGADRAGRTIVLPTDDNPQEWAKVFDKLGRPANPADYKLEPADAADPAFANAAAAKMHELGIPLKQGQALAAWWNEQAAALGTKQTETEQQAIAADDALLTKDWGAERQARTEIARRAAKQLGLTDDNINALEKAAGFAGTMKALAKVGDMLAEHGAEGMHTPGSFSMTPEGAKVRRQQLLADKDFRTKASDPKSSQWAELKKLDEIITSAM